MNVWGYWDCPYCDTKGIRGDHKHCPMCGTTVPTDVKFYLKDDVKEQVAEEDVNMDANWMCDYCETQNAAKNLYCWNCGSPKDEAENDYFSRDKAKEEQEPPKEEKPEGFFKRLKKAIAAKFKKDDKPKEVKDKQKDKKKTLPKKKKKHKKLIFAVFLGVVLTIFFFPVEKSSEVTSFEWKQSISIERFNNYDESGWTLPEGAHLHKKKQEVHHYQQVLDHYEKKTKQVPYEVLDGYDIDYEDLGNGQFKEVKTPKYKTEYKTEEYEEPVYKSVPVYQTKYYYDIDRWKKAYTVDTEGKDHEPVWGKLPDTVVTGKRLNDPKYGDEREGEHSGEYYAVTTTPKGKTKKIKYDLDEWKNLKVGDKTTYKTFWWKD